MRHRYTSYDSSPAAAKQSHQPGLAWHGFGETLK